MSPQREVAATLRPVFEKQGLHPVDASLLAGVAGMALKETHAVVRLADLTPAQRKLVLALIEAGRDG